MLKKRFHPTVVFCQGLLELLGQALVLATTAGLMVALASPLIPASWSAWTLAQSLIVSYTQFIALPGLVALITLAGLSYALPNRPLSIRAFTALPCLAAMAWVAVLMPWPLIPIHPWPLLLTAAVYHLGSLFKNTLAQPSRKPRLAELVPFFLFELFDGLIISNAGDLAVALPLMGTAFVAGSLMDILNGYQLYAIPASVVISLAIPPLKTRFERWWLPRPRLQPAPRQTNSDRPCPSPTFS